MLVGVFRCDERRRYCLCIDCACGSAARAYSFGSTRSSNSGTCGTVALGFPGRVSVHCRALVFISFVRTWRYFYFPVKEDLSFAFECLVRIPLQGVQLGTDSASGVAPQNALPRQNGVQRGPVREYDSRACSFMTFGYALLFAYYGGWYALLGFTHFFVHIVMALLVGR